MKTFTPAIALILLVVQGIAVPGGLAQSAGMPTAVPILPQMLQPAAAAALNTSETLICGIPSAAQVCAASRGDPGTGSLHPCATAEPSASANIVGFATWYAVHAYEERALFQPQSRPAGQNWPFPSTPLPIPEAAPHVCRDLWDDLGGAAPQVSTGLDDSDANSGRDAGKSRSDPGVILIEPGTNYTGTLTTGLDAADFYSVGSVPAGSIMRIYLTSSDAIGGLAPHLGIDHGNQSWTSGQTSAAIITQTNATGFVSVLLPITVLPRLPLIQHYSFVAVVEPLVPQNDAGTGMDASNSIFAPTPIGRGVFNGTMDFYDREDAYAVDLVAGEAVNFGITGFPGAQLFLYNQSRQFMAGGSNFTVLVPSSGAYIVQTQACCEYGHASNYQFAINGTTVTPVTMPDLVVTSVNVTSQVADGQTVEISARFGNQGNATGQQPFTIEYRLDGATFLRQWWPAGIPAGWFGTSFANTTVHGAGTHTIDVTIDADNNLTESDESNNAASATVEVATPTGAPFSENFESGSAGWTATGLWSPTTDRSGSPSTSWYYGNQNAPAGPQGNNYNTGAANNGELRSPPIDLGGLERARLTFWTFWRGEGNAWEHPIVRVHTANTTFVVFDQRSQQGEGQFEANLSAFVGQTIQVSFLWNTIDSTANDFEGWYIDDVVIDEADAITPVTAADLIVSQVFAPSEVLDGTQFFSSVTIRNNGTGPTVNNVTIGLYLDDTLVATSWIFAGFETGFGTGFGTTLTALGPGIHVLKAVVDIHGNETELNETNNVLSTTFLVVPAAQLSLDLRDLRRVPLVTEFGDLRHPLARFAVDVKVCNAKHGLVAAQFPGVSLLLQGGKANKTGAGSTSLPTEFFPNIPPGGCITRVVTFDTPGVVGDFTLVGTVFASNEGDKSDNTDRETSFNLVGEEGGVALLSRRT